MNRCPSCGIDVNEDQVICVNCGVQLRVLKVEVEEKKKKMSPCLWAFLFILLPLIIVMIVIISLPDLFE